MKKTHEDSLFLAKIKARTLIGVHARERRKPRPVILDLEWPSPGARKDSLAGRADYEAVARAAQKICLNARCHLIETLAEEVAGELLGRFGLLWIRLRLTKPRPFKGVAASAVQIFRTRSGDRRRPSNRP